MKLETLITLAVIAGMFCLVGCKPKPISGQIFIVDETGVGTALGGVQILLVDEKEAIDFVNRKNAEAKQKFSKTQLEVEKLKAELAAEQAEYDRKKATNDAYIASQSYTNDPRYIALLNESDNIIKTNQTLVNAVNYLRSKYGEPPTFFVAQNHIS